MIAYIRGTLVEKEPSRVIIEAAGVGYEILIPLSTFDKIPQKGDEAKLLVSHCVREDDELLFGFSSDREKDMFLKLTGVSGVGPKIALAILSGSSLGELCLAIASGNAKRLASIKGVGRKTAEKICVELKDKVNPIEALAATSRQNGADSRAPMMRDAILALSALGFNEETSNKMVSTVLSADPSIADVETIVRKALARK